MPRSVASGRTTATNRVAVQDIKSSLSFNGTSSKVALTQTAGLPLYSSNTAYTILAWVKPSNNLGAQVNTIYADGSTAGISPFFYININAASGNHNIGFFIRNDAAATVKSYNTAIKLNKNQWNRVAFVDNNGVVRVYINGVLDTNSSAGLMDYTRTGTFTMNTSTWGAATRDTTMFYLNGSLSNCRLYKSALTFAQTELAFNGGEPDAANRVGKYDFQEGAGTTAYDTSGNGNNGTITSGTFTSDVPTKKRGVVGGNKVYNSDFEFAPPTNVNQTSANWMDGSAAGSATNKLFGWHANTIGTSGYAVFDSSEKYSGSYSLHLNNGTSGTSTFVYSSIASSAGIPTNFVLAPSTSYTLTYRLKINVVSGSGGTVKVIMTERSGSGTAVIDNLDTYTTSSDWALYTKTFTTNASCRWGFIKFEVGGTHVADAWLDMVDVRETTPSTRTAVT